MIFLPLMCLVLFSIFTELLRLFGEYCIYKVNLDVHLVLHHLQTTNCVYLHVSHVLRLSPARPEIKHLSKKRWSVQLLFQRRRTRRDVAGLMRTTS